jgi:hypothetical protein
VGPHSKFLLLAAVALTLAACGNPGSGGVAESGEPATAEEQKPSEPRVIKLGAGSGDRFGGDQKREKLWSVQWQSAEMEVFDQGGSLAGTLQQVTGQIVSDGQNVSSFTATSAVSDRDQERLWLTGNVKIVSRNPDMTLTCDKVLYEADIKLIKAQGNIRIESSSGTLGGMPELWAKPDLSRVGTPDAF